MSYFPEGSGPVTTPGEYSTVCQVSDRVEEVIARMAALEHRFAYLCAHFGLDANAAAKIELPVPAAVLAPLREGKRLTAVKAYRQIFGANFNDAKRAIRRIEKS